MINKLILITSIVLLISCDNKKSDDPLFLLGFLGASGIGTGSSTDPGFSQLKVNLENAKAVGVAKNSITRNTSNTTNAVVVNNDNSITPAFSSGNITVKNFYTLKNKGVLIELSDDVYTLQVDGELNVSQYALRDYQPCRIIISNAEGSAKCLDLTTRSLFNNDLTSAVSFDLDGNVYTVSNDRDGARRIKKYTVEGNNKEIVYSTGSGNLINLYIARVSDEGEVLINHYSFATEIFRFDSIKNGVTTLIDSNSTGTNYTFVEKFPDNKFYFSHNIGGANGTGIFYYDPNTTSITNWSTTIDENNTGNWDDWSETYSATNFCSAGNGYLVRNNGQVYYKALPQAIGITSYKLYKLYPRLQVVHITGIDDVVAIYSIEDSEEILVAGKPVGSSLITFRLVNTNNLSSRATAISGLSNLPEGLSVNQNTKTIEIIDSKTIKTFDFTTGTATYSEREVEVELTQLKTL
ncbi:hypothetical protein [Leptospira sp. GIMC2001]|uniref:hypothetical protein n=1 Tax=Leptospira sp. GIMC2001 TaxID=1513297 RepID=UPI00234AB48C|nr:hypothetical protein [Leptospira sp. GIMC2001]WCL50771.1 hypothetical protein O4O04_08145 [Leptospira sp. GIMC2001]